jgi:TRAP-type C4-dicarboxylate transport system permease small subunit
MFLSRKISWLSNFFYKISYWAGATLLSLIFFMMILQVFCRYALNRALSWPEETSLIFFSWVVFLGASLALKDREHVGINFVIDFFPIRFKNMINILIDSMVVFFSGYLLIYGWKLSVFVGTKQTTTFWNIPYFYLYLSTCVGGGLLLIQGILSLMERLGNSLGASKK